MAAEQLTPKAYADNGTDVVVEHEISHGYFGNSVSPRRWSDVWLNEGHADYYQTLWTARAHGISLEDAMRGMYQDANARLRKEGPIAARHPGAYTPRAMAP
ncbi:M1 family aminopeptidase [Streptomyces sp. NPDC048751]|uniref:M1 family aminopeptidase n=1 Tax=Streptomyces sp. NPDC048751 TaxID=3365591 RepID=UPI00371A770D